ncbi:MAG: hypothetical protein ACOYVD_05890 [Bacillota bacterium]
MNRILNAENPLAYLAEGFFILIGKHNFYKVISTSATKAFAIAIGLA